MDAYSGHFERVGTLAELEHALRAVSPANFGGKPRPVDFTGLMRELSEADTELDAEIGCGGRGLVEEFNQQFRYSHIVKLANDANVGTLPAYRVACARVMKAEMEAVHG